MNKKLVAVAVAGVLAAPLAANAQTANVTLYGRLNLDYELVNGKQPFNTGCNGAISGCNQPNPTVSRVSSNSSRVGVRGTESLGGGLNAIFQIETGIFGDNGMVSTSSGTGAWASRETFAGLQGTWGTFKIGNFLAPYDDLHPIFGNVPTYTSSILSTADLWAQGTLLKGDGGFDARLANSLRYDSPVWNGFNFSGQIALRDSSGGASTGANGGNTGDHAAETRHAYVWDVSAYYNNGPIQAGIGYESNIKVRQYTSTPTVPVVNLPLGQVFNANDWALTVTGAYNFGVVRPALVYERLDYEVPQVTAGQVESKHLTRDFWGISLTAPIGPGALYFFFGDALGGKGSAEDGARVGGLTKGSNTSSQQWEISYTYPLSKRTQLYAGWVLLRNDKNAAYTFNINAYTVNTACQNPNNAINQDTCGVNGKPQGLVFGMIHLF